VIEGVSGSFISGKTVLTNNEKKGNIEKYKKYKDEYIIELHQDKFALWG